MTISTPVGNNRAKARIDNPTMAAGSTPASFRPAAPFTFGNVGPRSPDVRTDFTRNVDVVMVKKFPFIDRGSRDQSAIPRRVLQPVQHAAIRSPNGSVTQPQFGKVTPPGEHLAPVSIRA